MQYTKQTWNLCYIHVAYVTDMQHMQQVCIIWNGSETNVTDMSYVTDLQLFNLHGTNVL